MVETFTFVPLRYSHDLVREEFVNAGILVVAEGHRPWFVARAALRAPMEVLWGVEPDFLVERLEAIRCACDRLEISPAGEHAGEVAQRLLPDHYMSCLRWRQTAGGGLLCRGYEETCQETARIYLGEYGRERQVLE